MDERAAEARRRADDARLLLEDAERAVAVIESSCGHKWGKPEHKSVKASDGGMRQDLMGHFTVNGDGSINAPYVYVPPQHRTWWERSCDRCGKRQMATSTDKETVTTERPVFPDR